MIFIVLVPQGKKEELGDFTKCYLDDPKPSRGLLEGPCYGRFARPSFGLDERSISVAMI